MGGSEARPERGAEGGRAAPLRALGRVVAAGPRALSVEAPGFPAHSPGQFAMLRPEPGLARVDPLLPRPMALYRREGDVLEFRFKPVGRGTRILGSLPPGARIAVTGPLGRGFRPPAGPALLVGGGTGIASLYDLARESAGSARLALGGAGREDLLGLDDFRALGCPLDLATEDGSAGRRGRVADGLAVRPGESVYACGPGGLLRAVAALAEAAGAPCQVSLESPMACGFGICLGCVVPARDGYRYVCTQGPVFDASELRWEALP